MTFIKKNWLPILLVIAIGLAFVLNYSNSQKKAKESTYENEISTLIAGTKPMCFLYEEQVDINDETKSVNYNREFIEIAVTEAGFVTGQHFIIPSKGDKNIADFIGIKQEGIVNVAATARSQGETWQEQRVYKISDDKLFVGYQEIFVPKYQNDLGLYMFEDINKLVFETEDFFLSKTDCAMVDVLEF